MITQQKISSPARMARMARMDDLLIGLFCLCAGVAGCSGWTSDRVPEDPRPLMKAVGEAPSVQVVLTEGANERQLRTCHETVTELGAPPIDAADAAVTATVDLSGEDQKTLTVTSRRRGQVLKQQRPSWRVDDLCADALSAALRAWAAETGKAVPPPPKENQPKVARRPPDAPGDDSRASRRGRREGPATPRTQPERAPADRKASRDPWGDL